MNLAVQFIEADGTGMVEGNAASRRGSAESRKRNTMETDRQDEEQARQSERMNESGSPGGGVGRREEPGHTGVYPMSASEGASPDAGAKGEMAWGQGERGAEGYEDSGDSETFYVPEESQEGEL